MNTPIENQPFFQDSERLLKMKIWMAFGNLGLEPMGTGSWRLRDTGAVTDGYMALGLGHISPAAARYLRLWPQGSWGWRWCVHGAGASGILGLGLLGIWG